MTTTEPTTADLAAELATLRAEFQEWRDLSADEVRTHRLVIDDHEGNERVIVGEPYDGQFGIAINFKPEDTVYGQLSLSEASFTLGESPNYGETIRGCLSFNIDEHEAIELHTAKLDSGAIRADFDVETREVPA